MKPLLLAVVLGVVQGAVAEASDFATEMLGATFKFYNPDSTATCFLVRRDAADPALYLVTAAHVLEHTKGPNGIVVLREGRGGGSYRRVDHTIPIRRDGKPLWVRHATEDAAALRLAGPLPVAVGALPVTALADEKRIAAVGLSICSPLYIFTYPQRFESNDAGFALARKGIVASYPLMPVQQYHTFLADFTTFAGDSGGPVFVPDQEGHPVVVGIVLSLYRHDERVTTEYEERTIHHPFGLGRVLQAQFVREAVEQAAQQAVAVAK